MLDSYKGLNPAELEVKVARLSKKIENNRHTEELQRWAMYNYIELLTNFSSHDIKNAVHNLDGAFNTLEWNNIQENDIETINQCLNNIRTTIADFQKMSPDQTKKDFTLSNLFNSLDIVNRGLFNQKNINCTYEIDNEDIIISHSLHNIMQAINNLIINSVKALENIQFKKIHITCKALEDKVEVVVADNGCGIEKKEKLFVLYHSTTGGSGIGLYHAKFTFENINGTIALDETNNDFNTVFKITFPIK
jgi:signal transduction histidine kinase